MAFGEKVTQRPVERACEAHRLFIARHESKRTLDGAHIVRRTA
jgi:hypothetical protein